MIQELGPQAPRWVLQVDVTVPQIQETTVHEIPEVQVVERPPFMSGTPVATLGEQEVVTEVVLCSQHAMLLRFRVGEWEARGLGEAQLLLHRETARSVSCCAMA